MEIQSVQEFQQNQIKKLNLQYKIEVFSTRLRISKAFTAEQKHREYKKYWLKVKEWKKKKETG